MSPTAPPPSCLHPQPHHLPHTHYHSLPSFWKLKNYKRMWFEIIYFKTCGSERFWNSKCFSTETTEYFFTNFMYPFLYMVTNNVAEYQFLTLWNIGKIEGNKYLQFAMFCICHHFENYNKTIFQRVHNETFTSVFVIYFTFCIP